jgi:hypothetical protein
MRAILAACLLLLQLEPLAGVAICRGLALASPEQMEDDCPMRGATPSQQAQGFTGPTISSHESPLDCVFTEAVLAGASALVRDRAELRLCVPPAESASWHSASMRGTENPSPPVPPPNS